MEYQEVNRVYAYGKDVFKGEPVYENSEEFRKHCEEELKRRQRNPLRKEFWLRQVF